MLKKIYSLDLLMLSLLILCLPSIEGPKNIFLVGYLTTRTYIEIAEFNLKKNLFSHWDYLFILIVFTALLSTIFAAMPDLMGETNLEEWKGYRVFLTAILTAWFLSRAKYKPKNYILLLNLIIIGSIPPLIWGLYQYLVIHTKTSLELHSVGHVNHSAIYLVMIFGATIGWFLNSLNDSKIKISNLFSSQMLMGFLSFFLFLSIIIGQSRGAFIFGILLAILLVLLIPKNKTIKITGLITILTIVALTFFLKVGVIEKQINYQKTNNVLSFRDKVWNVSIEAARFSPLLGIGMSNWHFINLDLLKKSVELRQGNFNPGDYGFPGHSHNLYLTALVERGVIGLMVTLIFMGAWIRHLIKTYRQAIKSKISGSIWAGSFSAWVTTFGIGTVNTTFHHEHGILACLLFGLYLSYARFLKK